MSKCTKCDCIIDRTPNQLQLCGWCEHMHRDELPECPGCGARFTARELGRPELDVRHTRACPVRWQQGGPVGCAWSWPFPYSLGNAFALGERNAFEVVARYGSGRQHPLERFSGAARRLACEARARYTAGVRR